MRGVNDAAELCATTGADEDIDLDEFFLGLQVPEGRRVYVAFEDIKLSENTYTIEWLIPENGFTGGDLCGFSYLYQGNVDVVQARLYRDVTPDGDLGLVNSIFLDAGSVAGQSRAPHTFLLSDILRSWTKSPVLRILRESGGKPYRFSHRMIVFEREI